MKVHFDSFFLLAAGNAESEQKVYESEEDEEEGEEVVEVDESGGGDDVTSPGFDKTELLGQPDPSSTTLLSQPKIVGREDILILRLLIRMVCKFSE